MRAIKFEIPGPPVAWQRAGVDSRRGKKRHFKRTKVEEYQRKVKLLALEAGVRKLEGPVRVVLEFRFAWPKKDWRARKPKEPAWMHARPDLDNLVKCILDALNGVAYEDDGQVALITAIKRRGAQGSEQLTRVTIANASECD